MWRGRVTHPSRRRVAHIQEINSRGKRRVTRLFSERRLRSWRERVGLWLCSINTAHWAGREAGDLQHPSVQTGCEIHSVREIKSGFPGTAGGSTFQYKRRSGRGTHGFEGIKLLLRSGRDVISAIAFPLAPGKSAVVSLNFITD